MKLRKIIGIVILYIVGVSSCFSSPSLYSTTGLVLMPSAKQLPAAGYTISFSKMNNRHTSDRYDLVTGSFGLTDEIEVGVASIDDQQKNKLLFAGKYQITKETGINPAVGIGIIHLPRDMYLLGKKEKVEKSDTTYYVVASQKLTFPRQIVKKYSLRGHLGYGGEQVIDGIFGGIEFVYSKQLTLMCEYDAKNINAGVNLFLSPGIAAKGTYTDDFWSVGVLVEIKGK